MLAYKLFSLQKTHDYNIFSKFLSIAKSTIWVNFPFFDFTLEYILAFDVVSESVKLPQKFLSYIEI